MDNPILKPAEEDPEVALEEIEAELQQIAEDTSAPPSARRMTTMHTLRERLRDKVKKLTLPLIKKRRETVPNNIWNVVLIQMCVPMARLCLAARRTIAFVAQRDFVAGRRSRQGI